MEQPIPFSMAFQPIVDVQAARVYAFEALARGPNGEPAWSVLSQVNDANRYAFDQSCRVKAITLANRLKLVETGASLSINFLPGAVYSAAACIQLTLRTAREQTFPLDRLIFEITEGEQVSAPDHLQSIANEYRRHGFKIAIDDFGAGYANLNLLANLSCNILKLDMALTRDLHLRPKAERVVRSVAQLCSDLGISLVAEGIETIDEYHAIENCGIRLMQGYLLAKPAFEALPDLFLPSWEAAQRQPGLHSGTAALSGALPHFAGR